MRRGRAQDQKSPIEIGALRLDPASRTSSRTTRLAELAAREFDLLHLLMANAGEVLRRERIMDEVWDPHWFGPTKTLDVHISWLRKKIEDDPSHPTYITTIQRGGLPVPFGCRDLGGGPRRSEPGSSSRSRTSSSS